MFTAMFNSLVSGLSVVLDLIIKGFLNALDLSLSTYLTYFPFLGELYNFLRFIALGLIVIIAGKELATFWLGAVDTSYMQDRPVNILLRSAIAAALVYFGGYVLQMIVEFGTLPYKALLDASAVINPTATVAGNITAAVGEFAAGALVEAVIPGAMAIDLALSLMNLTIILLIAFNLFKLMVEVAERYLLVGVLVFTSPIVYPTLSTRASTQIFKRWTSMFVSAVIMMSVSVAFLKLIIAGIATLSSSTGLKILVHLFLILAMCKIAQRADSYLQQLGLNVATTGSNMLDDILAISRMTRGGKGGGSKASVLGGGAVGAMFSRTALGRGVSRAASDFKSGRAESLSAAVASGAREAKAAFGKTAFGAGAHAFQAAKDGGKPIAAAVGEGLKETGKATPIGKGVAAVKKNNELKEKIADGKEPENGEKPRSGFVAFNAAALSDYAHMRFAKNANERDAAMEERKKLDEQDKKAAQDASAEHKSTYALGNRPLPAAVEERANSGGKFTRQEADDNRRAYGLGGSAFASRVNDVDGSPAPALTNEARAAGLRMDETGEGDAFVNGNGNDVNLGMWLNGAADGGVVVPPEVGADRFNDESLSEEEAASYAALDRADFTRDANNIVENSIDNASPKSLHNMLESGKGLSGSKKDLDSYKANNTPQAPGESAVDYTKRIAETAAPAARGAHSFSAANKYFGQLAKPGMEMTSYSTAGGNLPGARTHSMTFQNSTTGETHQVAALNDVAYKSLSRDERENYTAETMSDGSKYYIRNDNYGSSKTDAVEGSGSQASAVSVETPIFNREQASANASQEQSVETPIFNREQISADASQEPSVEHVSYASGVDIQPETPQVVQEKSNNAHSSQEDKIRVSDAASQVSGHDAVENANAPSHRRDDSPRGDKSRTERSQNSGQRPKQTQTPRGNNQARADGSGRAPNSRPPKKKK